MSVGSSSRVHDSGNRVEVLHVENEKAYVRGNLSTISRIVVNGTNRIIPGQRVALANQTAGRE